jgi:hypothetical protein
MSDTTQAEQAFQMPTAKAEHKRFKPFEGKFRSEVKMWMGPGDPMVSTGTMINSLELEGLYLQQDYVGDQNDGPFPAFEGKGFWGYNTTTEKYEGFWIDNASTTMQNETGAVDSSGKVWEMRGEMVCAQTKQNFVKRSVITLQDNDHHKMEMYFTGPDGKEMKTMEIHYERVV